MNRVKWDKLYSTGIQQIDRHNHYLFGLLHHAHQRASKSSGPKLKRIDFEDLLRYAQFHFAREEVWMGHTHYPALSAHEEEHKQLRQSLAELCGVVQHDVDSTREALALVIDRFLHHIKNWDADYGTSESAIRLISYLRCNKS